MKIKISRKTGPSSNFGRNTRILMAESKIVDMFGNRKKVLVDFLNNFIPFVERYYSMLPSTIDVSSALFLKRKDLDTKNIRNFIEDFSEFPFVENKEKSINVYFRIDENNFRFLQKNENFYKIDDKKLVVLEGWNELSKEMAFYKGKAFVRYEMKVSKNEKVVFYFDVFRLVVRPYRHGMNLVVHEIFPASVDISKKYEDLVEVVLLCTIGMNRNGKITDMCLRQIDVFKQKMHYKECIPLKRIFQDNYTVFPRLFELSEKELISLLLKY